MWVRVGMLAWMSEFIVSSLCNVPSGWNSPPPPHLQLEPMEVRGWRISRFITFPICVLLNGSRTITNGGGHKMSLLAPIFLKTRPMRSLVVVLKLHLHKRHDERDDLERQIRFSLKCRASNPQPYDIRGRPILRRPQSWIKSSLERACYFYRPVARTLEITPSRLFPIIAPGQRKKTSLSFSLSHTHTHTHTHTYRHTHTLSPLCPGLKSRCEPDEYSYFINIRVRHPPHTQKTFYKQTANRQRITVDISAIFGDIRWRLWISAAISGRHSDRTTIPW